MQFKHGREQMFSSRLGHLGQILEKQQWDAKTQTQNILQQMQVRKDEMFGKWKPRLANYVLGGRNINR